MKAIYSFIFLVSIWSVHAEPPDIKGWTETEKIPGLTLYEKKIPGSKIIALRGDGVFDVPLWKIASVLLDTERAKEWVDSLEISIMVKRINRNTYIEYNHIRTPPIVTKDREFVSEVTLASDPIEKSFVVKYKPSNIKQGIPMNTGYVRGEMRHALFYLISIEKGTRTRFVAEIHADPKGSIPGWLVNFFQRGWPTNTFNAMTKQASKPNIAIPAEFFEVIQPLQKYN